MSITLPLEGASLTLATLGSTECEKIRSPVPCALSKGIATGLAEETWGNLVISRSEL